MYIRLFLYSMNRNNEFSQLSDEQLVAHFKKDNALTIAHYRKTKKLLTDEINYTHWSPVYNRHYQRVYDYCAGYLKDQDKAYEATHKLFFETAYAVLPHIAAQPLQLLNFGTKRCFLQGHIP